MSRNSNNSLPWPLEAALNGHDSDAELSVPGSNLVLDLHGDPAAAKLVVFSDGNHHMALEETLAAFARMTPEVEDVFYATTPPRVIIDALKGGRVRTGNLSLSVSPHVFISPGDVMEGLQTQGLVGPHEAVMQSSGLAILVHKGNPKNIENPLQLLDADIRLAISNPVTEKASFSVYAAALYSFTENAGKSKTDAEAYLLSDAVVKSQIIHHREIPQILASGTADASLVYSHLALRYTRIFPDHFDLIEVDIGTLPDPDRFITTYHMALVADGGPFGAQFAAFYKSPEVGEIYTRHGLRPHPRT
ncbi:MAG: substrate-binding domain-containing protein [Alphaproteobacteria bacterium]|jgi:hypothetical protein|nr:substrate-binding domain-containing protein [Alphaproteobacteria bacterium]